MIILGIESSCDDTAAAVIKDSDILSEIVYTQLIHEKWGGVIPELAGRDHAKKILPTVRQAIDKAGISPFDLTGIAVTSGPGLAGSVLVGLSFAKSLSYMLGIPLCGINHLEGHIFGALLDMAPPCPFIALLVSGGHTHLYLSEYPGQYKLLGKTRDDAAGEAFDKIAKYLGYSYPGGPHIERLSKDGNANSISLPKAMCQKGNLEFSFSGLKTAAINIGETLSVYDSKKAAADLAAALQQTIADILEYKMKEAMKITGVRRIVISGGVVANSKFREKLDNFSKKGIDIIIPQKKYCTDNAVMIAYAGRFRLTKGDHSPLNITARPIMPLDQIPFAFQ